MRKEQPPFDQRIPVIADGIQKVMVGKRQKKDLFNYATEIRKALHIEDGFPSECFELNFVQGVRTAMEGLSPQSEETRDQLERNLLRIPQAFAQDFGKDPSKLESFINLSMNAGRDLSYRFSTGRQPNIQQIEELALSISEARNQIPDEDIRTIETVRQAIISRRGLRQ